MFQTDTVQDTRPFFFETWAKHKKSATLTPLEAQILEVMLAHPEYHTVFDQADLTINRTYFAALGDTNPFLHMGLHLALREQISTNRPTGITEVFNTLKTHPNTPLDAEHLLMQCLEDFLWQAQQNNHLPDESAYLAACQALI